MNPDDSTDTANGQSLTDRLAQIDSEIYQLLKDGQLSSLNYGLKFRDEERTDRTANLKALLIARRHYRELMETLD